MSYFLPNSLDRLISFLLPPQSSRLILNQQNDLLKAAKTTVDYIIISASFLNQEDDVHKLLINLRPLCHDRTRLIFFFHRFKKDRFSCQDVSNFLIISDCEVVLSGKSQRFKYLLARPLFLKPQPATVSIIVPVRNEKNNIAAIIERAPNLGQATEVVFVEGGSTDGTRDECQRLINNYQGDKKIKLVVQSQLGKGNAVKEAIFASSHEVMVILDADLVIPPEELVYFYDAFIHGKAEFLNASRLVYPMEPGAMPFLNRLGNRFFGWLYSWLMGQKMKDLFGGTKMFRKSDYQKIDQLRPYFNSGDQWGDVDMFFGATKLGLKIQDIPVHYYARLHGLSHMRRYSYAWFLVKAFRQGWRKIKPSLF